MTGEPENGKLATDRPHVFKAFGGYSFNWNGRTDNVTTVSAFTTFQSGTPIHPLVSLYSVTSAILNGRGDLGRTEMFSETDLLSATGTSSAATGAIPSSRSFSSVTCLTKTTSSDYSPAQQRQLHGSTLAQADARLRSAELTDSGGFQETVYLTRSSLEMVLHSTFRIT